MRNILLVACIFATSSCGLEPSGKRAEREDPKGEPKVDTPTSAHDYENKATAQLKGYHAVNRIVQTRLLGEGSEVKLGRYLNSFYDNDESTLIDLLGVHTGKGRQNQFINATPNSTNMLLWFLVLRGFAKDLVAVSCGGDPLVTIELRADATSVLKSFCKGVSTASGEDKAALWELIMQYDAPQSERDVWLKFIAQYKSGNTEHLEDAIAAIFMNPYFLLSH